MRRKQFRILPGILAAALALSLCACGASQTTSTSANSQKDAETTAVAASTETAATNENSTESNAEENSETNEITWTSGEEQQLSNSDTFQTYATSVDSFTDEELPFYFDSPEAGGTIQVHFLNGIHEIPYISVEEVAELLKMFYTRDTEDTDIICIKDDVDTENETVEVLETETEAKEALKTETEAKEVLETENVGETEVSVTENTEESYNLDMGCLNEEGIFEYILLRENGSEMIVDFTNNMISFTDIDEFVATPGAANGLDIVGLHYIGDNEIMRHISMIYQNPAILTVDLNYYGIFPVVQDGHGYLPVQTINDLVFNRIGARLYYNGEGVIVAAELNDSVDPEEKTTASVYYSVEQTELSDEMAVFNYNELCLALDYSYGLQDEHNISSFNQLFIETGLYEKLQSTNTDDVYNAIFTLCNGYFADGHSEITAPSCYGSNYLDIITKMDSENAFTMNASLESAVGEKFDEARDAVYPDGPVGYEEVGDTAYVTFDDFTYDSERDYYHTEITNNPNDTIELLLYANEQIHRDGSPIKNVVLDLSNNGGGELDAAVAVISWMIGAAEISIEDVITGAMSNCMYEFDANLNGVTKGDDGDDVSEYNLFCLTSPSSFSCGNLVPAVLKSSSIVTMMGRATTGGACAIMYLTTADGTRFQMSGPRRLNTMNNGSYYSVDEGVEPDIRISNIENFYDREALTEYIDGLF